MYSTTESENTDPKRVKPITDIAEPNRAMLRRAKEDPSVHTSITDSDDPNRLTPSKDSADPRRAKLRRAKDDPR